MIIPPGFVRVFILYENALPHQCQNTIDLAVDDPPDQSDADLVSTHLSSSYKGFLNTASSFHGIKMLVGQDGADPLELLSVAGAGAGTQTGALAPAQVQGLLRKHTSHSGRKGRGRVYLPDVQEALINDSGIANSTQTTLWSAVAAALGDIPSSVGPPFTFTALLHEDGSAPYAVTQVTVETAVATQRRRWPRP